MSLRYFNRRCDAGESGGEESNGGASRAEDKGEDVDDIVGRMRAGFRQTDDAAKVGATCMRAACVDHFASIQQLYVTCDMCMPPSIVHLAPSGFSERRGCVEDREPGEHDDEQPHRRRQQRRRRSGRVRPEERGHRRLEALQSSPPTPLDDRRGAVNENGKRVLFQYDENIWIALKVSKENSNSGPIHAVAVNHHVGAAAAHAQRAAMAAGSPVVGSPRVTRGRQVPLDQPSPIAARQVRSLPLFRFVMSTCPC